MRSPVSRPWSLPTCLRCDTYMVKFSLEAVAGPDRDPIYIQVYECPSCQKLTAEEITLAKDGDSDEAA